MFSTGFCGYRDVHYSVTLPHDATSGFAALR
jgi:hypothetical protein